MKEDSLGDEKRGDEITDLGEITMKKNKQNTEEEFTFILDDGSDMTLK